MIVVLVVVILGNVCISLDRFENFGISIQFHCPTRRVSLFLQRGRRLDESCEWILAAEGTSNRQRNLWREKLKNWRGAHRRRIQFDA